MLASGLMTPIIVAAFVAVLFTVFVVRSKFDDRKANEDLQSAEDDFRLSSAHPSLRGRERSYIYEVEVPFWLMNVMARLGFGTSVTSVWSTPQHLSDQEDSEDLQDS